MAIVDLVETQKCIFICNGGSCLKLGADEVTLALRSKIADLGLQSNIHTVRTKCIGRCEDAPVLFTAPDSCWHKNIELENVNQFINYYVLNQKVENSHVFYRLGEPFINSDSIPTNKRKKLKKYDNK